MLERMLAPIGMLAEDKLDALSSFHAEGLLATRLATPSVGILAADQERVDTWTAGVDKTNAIYLPDNRWQNFEACSSFAVP